MPIVFNGPTTTIELASGVTVYDVADIYSRWKDWMLQSDNSKYLPAFRQVGGDPLGGGVYTAVSTFIRNDYGWTIKPPEEDIQIVLRGNLYPEDPNQAYYSPTVGGFDTVIRTDLSGVAFGVSTSGGSGGPTTGEIISALMGEPVEPGLTVKEALRLMSAVLAGKVAGGGTGTITIRDVADSKNRIVAAVDTVGNRTSITYDKS